MQTTFGAFLLLYPFSLTEMFATVPLHSLSISVNSNTHGQMHTVNVIKFRGPVVGIPVSYLECVGFESRTDAILSVGFVVLSSSSRKMLG